VTYRTIEDSPHGGAPQEFYLVTSGASTWRVTPGDSPETIADPTTPHEYAPLRMTRESLSYGEEDNSGDLVVTIPVDHAIAQLFAAGTPAEPVYVTVRAIHRSDPDAEAEVWGPGTVTGCSLDDRDAKLTIAPFFGKLRRRVPGIVFSSQCPYVLFGSGCELVADDWNASGTVSAVDGTEVTATVFGTQADGWWRGGFVRWADGRRSFVVAHVGTTVTLANAKPGLSPGATFDVFPGCDGTETVCREKFDNLVHHLGFPRIPRRNPFERSIV
jgi:uncharacterized phage protein (TIGR02218 family)